MSFQYPRKITVTRPVDVSAVGAGPYNGLLPTAETTVATNLPASIQFATARAKPLDLPGDAEKTHWRIFIPGFAAARELIHTWDIVTDDLGQRYQVVAPYWNSLGYNLMTERLEK